MRCPGLPLAVYCAAAIFALQAQPQAFGQAETPPPQGTPRGENFSAKPAPALFASDCTGAGCHKGPQGLGKRVGLAGFLREHYTNSRESAAALANYLASLPAPVERTPPAAQGQRPRRTTEPAEPPEAPAARGRRTAEPTEPPTRPARGQRGRQAIVAPTPPPEPPAPPQQFDIFD